MSVSGKLFHQTKPKTKSKSRNNRCSKYLIQPTDATLMQRKQVIYKVAEFHDVVCTTKNVTIGISTLQVSE